MRTLPLATLLLASVSLGACSMWKPPEISYDDTPRQAVLELNPKHPLIQRLNRTQDDPRLADWGHVLFNQAVLTLGARIEDPTTFVGRLNDLLTALTEQAPEQEAEQRQPDS